MRILLANDLPPGPSGGAEVHVGRLGDALVDLGHQVRVVSADGLKVGWRRVLDFWDPGARRLLRRGVDDFAPDVVHYHNIINELSTSVLGLGPPSVLTIHDPRVLGTRFGMDQDRSVLVPAVAARATKDRLARARFRRTIDATIIPNRVLAVRARELGFPNVHVVENFTPITPCGPPGSEVVFVGALEQHKGPDVLLDAWERIAARHPDVSLRIVGDGSRRPLIADRVRDAGPTARVRLVGSVEPDAVPAQLSFAAVVVVPSLGAENCPLVVLEAMAAGRPVVVSDWHGADDTVDDEVGAVVRAGDVSALAEVLDRLLSDRSLIDRLGDAARARAVERWSPAQVKRIVEVYESVRS